MINTLYKCFQHWSECGSVCIISDLHFDDEDNKKIDSNWISPEEQINIINKKVYKNDTFICLGDVGNVEWINKIKSKHKVLIMGNHDTGRSNYENYFDEIYEGPLFISEKIIISHEPIELEFAYNIHGHNHSAVEMYEEKGCNLAANVCNYTPINLNNDIIKKGRISKIESIHRLTIDTAIVRKKKRIINSNIEKYNKVMKELKNK